MHIQERILNFSCLIRFKTGRTCSVYSDAIKYLAALDLNIRYILFGLVLPLLVFAGVEFGLGIIGSFSCQFCLESRVCEI